MAFWQCFEKALNFFNQKAFKSIAAHQFKYT